MSIRDYIYGCKLDLSMNNLLSSSDVITLSLRNMAHLIYYHHDNNTHIINTTLNILYIRKGIILAGLLLLAIYTKVEVNNYLFRE